MFYMIYEKAVEADELSRSPANINIITARIITTRVINNSQGIITGRIFKSAPQYSFTPKFYLVSPKNPHLSLKEEMINQCLSYCSEQCLFYLREHDADLLCGIELEGLSSDQSYSKVSYYAECNFQGDITDPDYFSCFIFSAYGCGYEFSDYFYGLCQSGCYTGGKQDIQNYLISCDKFPSGYVEYKTNDKLVFCFVSDPIFGTAVGVRQIVYSNQGYQENTTVIFQRQDEFHKRVCSTSGGSYDKQECRSFFASECRGFPSMCSGPVELSSIKCSWEEVSETSGDIEQFQTECKDGICDEIHYYERSRFSPGGYMECWYSVKTGEGKCIDKTEDNNIVGCIAWDDTSAQLCKLSSESSVCYSYSGPSGKSFLSAEMVECMTSPDVLTGSVGFCSCEGIKAKMEVGGEGGNSFAIPISKGKYEGELIFFPNSGTFTGYIKQIDEVITMEFQGRMSDEVAELTLEISLAGEKEKVKCVITIAEGKIEGTVLYKEKSYTMMVSDGIKRICDEERCEEFKGMRNLTDER